MIYLDNNATTRTSPAAVAAMLPYFSECYYNASSAVSSQLGADQPRARAARAMATLLNAEDSENIVFTSGATESNNWVIAAAAQSSKGAFVFCAVEHPSVRETMGRLKGTGRDIREVPVLPSGRVDLGRLAELLDDQVTLISVMTANNETGVINPIQEIGQLIRTRAPAALFHTDATQAVGKMPVDLQSAFVSVDLLSFSAHKFHGPKGIGGLYVRPGITLEPLLYGGGQENGARAGTTNTPALAGLAAAAEEIGKPSPTCKGFRDLFESLLQQKVQSIVFHGDRSERLDNTSCVSFLGTRSSELVDALLVEGIVVGTGSACSADALHPPETLLKMGVDYEIAGGSIRVSFSRYNSESDVVALVGALENLVPIIRRGGAGTSAGW